MVDNFDLRKYLAENKLTSNSKSVNEYDSPFIVYSVAKAYKDYIKAKKDSAADVDFAEDPEKAYRYYLRKLNNIYSTRADRDAIEAILKQRYGSTLEEADTITEIKGFEEFKKAGFKLGDKVQFMGSAHPTHTKPIKLTGTIEYFEPADEIGVRVDGYGKFIPFFRIQSNIELIKEEQVMKRETLANNFRKELINLLKKHNAELSIDSNSEGSIDLNFDIKDSNGEFIASDVWLGSTTNGIIAVRDIEKTFQIED